MKDNLLQPENEVCDGYVFTRVCLSTGGGGIPVCIAGGIPACLAGLQWNVSQHALQVSRCTPRGSLRGLAWGRGSLGRHPRGRLRGLARGVSRPTPGGCIPACTEADPLPTSDSYCCGWYASYWNAFLYYNCFTQYKRQIALN